MTSTSATLHPRYRENSRNGVRDRLRGDVMDLYLYY